MLRKVCLTFISALVAGVTFVAPAQAAVTAFFSAGNTCTGATTQSFSTSGPAVQVSLCVSTTTEGVCGFTVSLQAANGGESGRFNLSNRTTTYDVNTPGVVFPLSVANPADPTDLGGTVAVAAAPGPVTNQVLATFDLTPQASATNASYVIGLNTATAGIDTAVPGANCFTTASTTPISPTITMTLSAAPAFTSAAPVAGVVNTAYSHTFTASGAPAPTFSVTVGTLPTGLALNPTTGVLSGTPTVAGTSNFTVTASNGVNPAATQAVTLTIAAAAQTITFANPGAKAFNTTPFASAATASSGLTVTLNSTTTGVCTVSGLNITMVTAGNCSITATQAGNANFAAAAPVTQAFTINAVAPGAPTIGTALPFNNSATVAFTAPAFTGGSAITGYTATCNPGAITGAGATSPITVNGLVNGTPYTCSVTATNIAGPGAASATASVTPAPTPVPPAFTSGTAVGPLTFGAAMATFNIAATGVPLPTITAGAAPAGLTFTSGGANTGTATLTGTPSAAGTFNLLVTATGTAPAATQTLVITVNKANQTITFTGPAAQTFSASPVAVSATAPGGTVVFTSTTPTICSVTGTSVTMITVGTCTIAANQAGNTNYNAAPQVTQSFLINQATQTITFGAQAARGFSAAAFQISPLATASSGLAVSYASTTPAVCSVSGTSVTTLTLGTCTVQATQAGNANFAAAAPVSQNITINQGTQTINFVNPPDTAVNAAPFSVAGFATASSGLAVTFASTTPAVCTTSGGNGATVTVLILGTCTISATQAGNANFAAAPAVTRSFQVIPPGAVGLTTSASPARYRQSVTLTASVTGTNPTGTVTFTVTTANGPVTLCNAVPLSGGVASCVVPGDRMVTPLVFFNANYSGDANNNSNSFTLQQGVNMTSSTLTASVTTKAPVAGRGFTISTMLTAQAPQGTITVSENGATVCSGPAALLPGATDIAVSTCAVNDNRSGARTFVVTYPHVADAGFEQIFLPVTVAASGPLDYTDMWWVGASENGWGVSITQHALNQFIVLYVYDDQGRPIWYVLPQGTWNANQTAFTGALYQPTGSAFSSYNTAQFNPFGLTGASVGTATITYNSASTATLTYTINGKSGTKSIQRQVFGASDGQKQLFVNDMWWAGLNENGWGMNIAQQGRVLFPVWYTYDSTGTTRFFAVPGGTWVGNTFTGDIYSTTSSAWLGANYIAGNFTATKVGTMSLTFSDQENAIMTYTVNGVTQTKAIARQPF